MKRYLVGMALVGLLVAVSVAATGCHGHARTETADYGRPAGEIQQKVCPVMGVPIDPDIYVDHEGRRIYFCCPACVEKFREDPDRYLAKLDAQL
jgi:YHS domain-containing protein